MLVKVAERRLRLDWLLQNDSERAKSSSRLASWLTFSTSRSGSVPGAGT